MRIHIIVLSFLIFAGISIAEKKHRHHKAHTHGAGKIDIAVDGPAVVVDVKISLHDLVGFEHAPNNKKQLQMIEDLKSAFKANPPRLASTPVCKLEKTSLDISRDGSDNAHKKNKRSHKHDHGHKHKHKNDHGHKHKKKGVHGDLMVRYTFSCGKGANLTLVSLDNLKTYPRLQRLSGQYIGESGAKKIRMKAPLFSSPL